MTTSASAAAAAPLPAITHAAKSGGPVPRAWWVTYLLDPLERAANTFLQQFATVLLAVGSGGLLYSQNWAAAANTAAFAAIASVVASAATLKVKPKSPAVDLVLRLVRTFAASVVGTLGAEHAVHTLSGANWQGAVAIAVPVTFTALLKGLAAMSLKDTIGASLIPKSWGVVHKTAR
jgi:hypothetical protein